MTAINLKKEIIRKLDSTLDESMLEIINKLLDKASLNSTLKNKLTKRALKAEEDIKNGKVYNKSEALKRLKLK